MPSAFFTGLSGLRSHSRAVEVVANNLANLNTVSFKGSRADFRDLFYQQIGQSRSGVSSQVGIGAAPITVSRIFEQGTIQSTGGLLDAAIQGEGFFIVKDGDLTLYTRAGNFQLNTNQEVVSINGEVVQGWIRNPGTGAVDTGIPPADITLQGNERIAPAETTLMSINANLSSSATTPFSRPIQIFDSLGSPHILTMVFTPVSPPTAGAASTFDVTVTIPASDVLDNSVAPPVPVAVDQNIMLDNLGVPGAYRLDFDANGQLITPTPPNMTIDMGPTGADLVFVNLANPLMIQWDLLDGLGQPRVSSVAAPSAVTSIFQNGTPPADLLSISIADGGTINGLYSDGRTLVLAQLALSRFTNNQGLQAVGNNNYLPTSGAGIPVTGAANEAGLGSVVGLSLEFSNVDIAQEFTNLLTFQRGFQANSRVITTADELNQEALNLKR